MNDHLVLCASVWSSHQETSIRRWIFLQFHCGWWSLHPEKNHMISWILRYSSTQGSRWDSEVIPGTWTQGSPCGKLIPCNRNRVLLCTEPGSSLKGGVGQNQCTSLTRYNMHHFNQIIWIRFCQIVYPCNVQNWWQKWSTYSIHTYWIPSKRTGLHGTK